MRYLTLLLISLLVLLTGCKMIPLSLKAEVCDRDNDGLPRSSYCGGNDCDDSNQNVGEPTDWFRDVDVDSFGAGEAIPACTQPDGYVQHNGDCDDTDELVNPDSTETCNGYDDNCDGGVDDENVTVWYVDNDKDGYGDPKSQTIEQCDAPDGDYIDNSLDCDDTTDMVSPDDEEICDDGIDQDCNGLVDDAKESQTWYADNDLDGYGNGDESLYSCQESVSGYTLDNTDCDDTSYDVSPAASEACGDKIDNDCDGEIDTDAENVPWYRDADKDGYGDEADTTTDCAPPDGYVGNDADCDDTTDEINPGVEEICNNGIDDNCDGSANECRFNDSLTLVDEAVTWIAADGGDFGCALAFGDFNGDSLDDLAVGAYEDTEGGDGAGAVLFFWGPLSTTGEVDAASYDARILGDAGDSFGRDIVLLDDMSGDSVPDLAVSAIGNDQVHVFFLPLAGAELLASSADTIVSGLTAGEYNDAGFGIASGDLNDDSLDDLVVGGYDSNQTWVFWGPLSAESEDQSSAGAVLQGNGTYDRYGYSVAVGDFSGDGLDDLAVGAPEATSGSNGEVYVYVGPVYSSSTPDYTFTGGSNERYGSKSFTMDLNGDGISDLGTSQRQASGVRMNWGGALSSTSGIGTDTWDPILGSGEDLDGDGVPDLLIAQSTTGGYTCGTAACVSIVYGSADETPAIQGTWNAASGISTVGAGAPEFTLDMVPDIIIGTPKENIVWILAGTGI